MRVLHAFVSQEHYTNWSTANASTTETIPTVDVFLREFGTPLITFDSTDREDFVRVVDGAYVRINYNYYNDLAAWNSSSVTEEDSPTQATEATQKDTAWWIPSVHWRGIRCRRCPVRSPYRTSGAVQTV